MVAPVLCRLLGEFPHLSLTVAGNFDLAQFSEFSRFAERVEKRPFLDWRLLPSEIAGVDINIIPLVINRFTEAKSNLKYYEAAMVEVPSVASPTAVYQSCIKHGSNGYLARTEDEWYAALRALIIDPDLRRRMGKRAYQQALERYVPQVIGDRALAAYRNILLDHRRRLGVEDNVPTATVLLADVQRAIRERAAMLTLCNALAEVGIRATLQIPCQPGGPTAAEAYSMITRHLGGRPHYNVQVGSDIACCDILLASDSTTAFRAWQNQGRASWVGYLVSEYEPAHLASFESRDEAERSYRLGLNMLVLDPMLTNWLDLRGDLDVKILPTWVECEPLAPDRCPEPQAVLAIGISSVTDEVWNEVNLALQRIGVERSELRLAICGAPGSCTGERNTPLELIASMAAPEYEAFLRGRPICVVLYPSGRPPWVNDLLARGCPVIAVVSSSAHRSPGAEFKEGVICVPADGHMIAQAIESLLIDSIRLGQLMFRSAAAVRSMPGPIEAACAILREYRAACGQDVIQHHISEEWLIDGPRSEVA
jgi:hypothetical protein